MKPIRQIALDYFNSHPEEKAVATSKGMMMLRNEWKDTHRYEYRNNETKCWICNQSWYAKEITRCPGFQHNLSEDAPTKIKRVLTKEYNLYKKTISKCEQLVRLEHKDWSTLTGKKIAVLYHTHGCGIEELEWIFDSSIPKQLKEDFEEAMEVERNRSRTAQVKELVLVKDITNKQ